jgi:hypothetical protein
MLWNDITEPSSTKAAKLEAIEAEVGGVFTLISAEGVKAPQGADFDKEKIVRNSVRFSLLDKSTGNIIFNTAVVVAKWDKAQDDVWNFPEAQENLKDNLNPVIFKAAKNSINKDTTSVIIELVVTIRSEDSRTS